MEISTVSQTRARIRPRLRKQNDLLCSGRYRRFDSLLDTRPYPQLDPARGWYKVKFPSKITVARLQAALFQPSVSRAD
jgi:hypothetical protein